MKFNGNRCFRAKTAMISVIVEEKFSYSEVNQRCKSIFQNSKIILERRWFSQKKR